MPTTSSDSLIQFKKWCDKSERCRADVLTRAHRLGISSEVSMRLLAELERGGWIDEKKASVRVLPTREKWAGMTYPEDNKIVKNYLKSLVENNIYPNPLF